MSNYKKLSEQEKKEIKEAKNKACREAKNYLLDKKQDLLTMHNVKESKNQEEEAKKVKNLLNKLEKYIDLDGGNITTSQLRNIFTKVRGEKSPIKLQLLRPKLAYISARQPNSKYFIKFIDEILQEVTTEEKAKGFSQFFEAIIAYHKFHHSNKK